VCFPLLCWWFLQYYLRMLCVKLNDSHFVCFIILNFTFYFLLTIMVVQFAFGRNVLYWLLNWVQAGWVVHDLILQLYANLIYYWCLSVKLVDFFLVHLSCGFWLTVNAFWLGYIQHCIIKYHWSADISIPKSFIGQHAMRWCNWCLFSNDRFWDSTCESDMMILQCSILQSWVTDLNLVFSESAAVMLICTIGVWGIFSIINWWFRKCVINAT